MPPDLPPDEFARALPSHPWRAMETLARPGVRLTFRQRVLIRSLAPPPWRRLTWRGRARRLGDWLAWQGFQLLGWFQAHQ